MSANFTTMVAQEFRQHGRGDQVYKLTADETFLKLQSALEETEMKIQLVVAMFRNYAPQNEEGTSTTWEALGQMCFDLELEYQAEWKMGCNM